MSLFKEVEEPCYTMTGAVNPNQHSLNAFDEAGMKMEFDVPGTLHAICLQKEQSDVRPMLTSGCLTFQQDFRRCRPVCATADRT
jgi:hypothetical protein